jgi:predicted dehydrogenase
MDLAGARLLAEAVEEAAVVSQMVLTLRYSAGAREFLTRVGELEAIGGHGVFVGSLRDGGPFATPWRLERGALLDLGPHIVDLLDAALGRVVDLRAQGDSLGWLALTLEHEGGALSQVSLCAMAGGEVPPARIDVYGAKGHARLEWPATHEEAFARMMAEFAAAVRSGTGHPLDARHGLRIQEILGAAESQL